MLAPGDSVVRAVALDWRDHGCSDVRTSRHNFSTFAEELAQVIETPHELFVT
jgi:hypothetical protein